MYTETTVLDARLAASEWYAVRTRSNHERVAADFLQARGVEVYLPLLATPSRRSDRRIFVQKPLFGGYFFVRTLLALASRVIVLRAPGVMSLIGQAAGPVPIPDWQIRSIRNVLMSRNPYEVLYGLHAGRRVRICTGSLSGAEGVIITGPGRRTRLAVSIELLGRSVVVDIDSADVEPIF